MKLALASMSGFRYDFGGMVFEDMAETSEAMYLEDLLEGGGEAFEETLDPSGCGEMLEDMLDYGGGATEDVLGVGSSSIDLNASTSPGTPVQPPPPVASVSNPCSPQANPCTDVFEAMSEPVSVVEPPGMELRENLAWATFAATMLPHDILRKAPRKRGEGKYFASGQKYEPCSWEMFIERVNEKIKAGKLQAVIPRRPKRKRQIRDAEDVTDPVVVALQAQAEIYEEQFNATTFFTWD